MAGDPVKVQIWRRVASFDFTPDECETGLPENSGYELIDEVGTTVDNYRDTNGGAGLAYGAMYCYRLIAVFPEPQGGESIVSEEICIEPIDVSAPTITHVTVVTTDENSGSVRVSWRRPFEPMIYRPFAEKVCVMVTTFFSIPFPTSVETNKSLLIKRGSLPSPKSINPSPKMMVDPVSRYPVKVISKVRLLQLVRLMVISPARIWVAYNCWLMPSAIITNKQVKYFLISRALWVVGIATFTNFFLYKQ